MALSNGAPDVNSEDTADTFWDLCELMTDVDSDTCDNIWAAIFIGDSNLAARAGMMCSMLDYCSPEQTCPDLEVPSIASPDDTLTGSLDLCAAEGVEGGSNTTLPSVEWGPNSCNDPSDCKTGQVCFFDEDIVSEICSCEDGLDDCFDVGVCTSYCALASTTTKITSLNAGATACFPDEEDTGCADEDVCIRVDNCQKWDCDPDTQGLVSKECDGKCRPRDLRSTSAQLANNGQSITLKLNAYASPLRSVACSTVFDADTSALLGSSVCSTSDNTITIKLASSATITRNQELIFASGSALSSQIDPSASFAGAVTVAPCTNCSSPKASVIGPLAVAQPCSGGGLLSVAGSLPPSFEASLSSDPSGRSTWSNVLWSLDASVGSSDGRAVLQAAVDRANAYSSPNDRLVLSMLSTEVTSLTEASYKLQVTVTSWLGTTNTATLTFAKTSGATAPAVKVVGSSEQTFRISAGVRVSADAGQVCNGRTVSWNWISTSGWSAIPKAGIATQRVYLAPPLTAIHGQSYQLQIAASFVGETGSTATSSVTLTAVGAAPSARLTGASGDIPDDAVLVLNATGSSDPETTRELQKLSYSWDCRREDYPVPCFTTSLQGDSASTPGVWRLSPSLLTRGKVHTITVTVSKSTLKGATPLRATASVSFRPRNAAEPFPRGTLTRQCSAAECSLSHSTSKDLTLLLVLRKSYTNAQVAWASTELPSLSTLVATSADNDANTERGTFILTIPAASLPSNLASITITANLALNNFTGSSIVTVPLNSAPYCSLNIANPSACIKLDMSSSTFPTAVGTLRAQGWADDLDTQLTYEFGVRSSKSDTYQQVGVTASAPVVGLRRGNVTLFVCAKDSQGSRTCGTVSVTILKPSDGFNAKSMLADQDLSSLGNDATGAQQGAAQLALLSEYIAEESADTSPSPKSGANSKASDADITLASNQAISLVSSIMSTTNLADLQQAQLALSSISNTANSNAGLLNTAAQTAILNAANTIATAVLAKSTVDSTFASQLLGLLTASAPVDATIGATGALDWLRKVISVAKQLGLSLGKTATPGAVYTVTGSGTVWLSVSALPSLTTVATTIRAGSGAAQLASSSSSSATTGRRSALQQFQTSEHFLNPRMAVALAASSTRRRQLQQASPPATTTSLSAVTAEAFLSLTGTAASGASGYSLGLLYVSSANIALVTALGSAKPAAVDLRGGLTYVEWAAVSSTSSVPVLDGTSSFIRIRIPAPGYDATKLGTCALYDSTANTISGSLGELSAGSDPAVFESYDAATGRVVCRAKVAGVYVVAQNQLSAFPSPPPSPPPASPPPPPGVVLPAPPPPAPPGAVPNGGIDPPITTPSPSPSPGTKAASSSSIPIAAVAGGVVGGVIILAILIAVFIIVRRRKWQVVVAAEGGTAAQPLSTVTVAAEPASAWQEGSAPPPPPASGPEGGNAGRYSAADASAADAAAGGAAAVVVSADEEHEEQPPSRVVEGVDFNLPNTPRDIEPPATVSPFVGSPRTSGHGVAGSSEPLRTPAIMDEAAPTSEPLISPRVEALRPSRPPSAVGASHPASHAGSRPASHAGSRPASHAGSRPASHAESRPASHAGSRPASATAQQRPPSASASGVANDAASEAVRSPAHMPPGEPGGEAAPLQPPASHT